MTEPLQSARRGPEKAGSVVVFLHGYGADGTDLLGLSEPLAPHLPTTAFYAPDAPEPSRNNPMGFQWFPIPWLDGSSEVDARISMGQSVTALNEFLDTVLAADTERAALLAESHTATDAHRIADIPGVIVHGRYDVVCPLANAWDLTKVWPKAKLEITPASGHSAFEAENVDALVRATDSFA